MTQLTTLTCENSADGIAADAFSTGTCLTNGHTNIGTAQECQDIATHYGVDIQIISTLEAPAACGVYLGGSLFFNMLSSTTQECSGNWTCLCECLYPPPPPPPNPPTPLPPPPPSPPPLPPFQPTEGTVVKQFRVYLRGLNLYEVTNPRRANFTTDYIKTFLDNSPGLAQDQIKVLDLSVDLIDTSVLTRIEWMAEDDDTARPMQTISWLNEDPLAVFSVLLSKYGTIDSVDVDGHSKEYSTLEIAYHNFPLLTTDFALVSDMSQVHTIVAEQALEGLEYTTVLVPTLVDGMSQLVSTMSNGKLTDPIQHPEVHYTCANSTLSYGTISDYTYCYLACVSDPLCEWAEYDTKTKACSGGEYVCGTSYLVDTVNAKRLGVKLRTDPVTFEGKSISGSTFLSATSNIYRPYSVAPPQSRRRGLLQAGSTKGLSCLLKSTAHNLDACTWSKVIGMHLQSYQHPSTGVGNIYQVESWGTTDAVPPVYVCPGLSKVVPVTVKAESMSIKTSSCASYLSNDIQAFFAVLVYDETTPEPDGRADCYIVASCGNVSTPMVPYDQEFATAPLQAGMKVVVMAKESMILPSNVDPTTGPLTLADAASATGSKFFSDFVKRASVADSYVFGSRSCVANHHGYYDSGEYDTSSVCLPSLCSIWGKSPSYREGMRFFEDACSTDARCCADEDAPLALCGHELPETACRTKVNGSAIALDYNELEFFPSIATYVLPDAALHQRKRGESDMLKYNTEKWTPTCTLKVDIFSNDSFSFGPDSKMLKALVEIPTSYSMHVSRACPAPASDPRLNELVLTAGKEHTHISRTADPKDRTVITAVSPLAPYSLSPGAAVPMEDALFNLTNMVQDTTARGTGFYDLHRPTEIIWTGAMDNKKYARIRLPLAASGNDGATLSDTMSDTMPSTVLLSVQKDGIPAPSDSRVVDLRVVKAASDTVNVCFSLCETDTVFAMTDFGEEDSGSAKMFFSEDAAKTQTGATVIDTVTIRGVPYYAPAGHAKLANFSSMHETDESNLMVVEIREVGTPLDQRRVTYRTLDRQNAVRQGAVCVRDLTLETGKTYEMSAQYPKAGDVSYPLSTVCTDEAASGQAVATVDYLTSVLPSAGRVVTSRYPKFKFVREEPDDWLDRYHEASNFAVTEPDTHFAGAFEVELGDIERAATSVAQMNHLMRSLCDDIGFAKTDPESGLPISACLGFTYRKRMSAVKQIRSFTGTSLPTYGDFCFMDHPALFTDKTDCETRYPSGCVASDLSEYPQYDMYGNILRVAPPLAAERLYQPANATLVDTKTRVGREGGSARSVCGTHRDRMIDFHSAKLFLSYPMSPELRTEMTNKGVTLDSTLDPVRAEEITRKIVEATEYAVQPKEVADVTASDRVTFLRQSMYSVIGNKLSQQMQNTSLYLHTDMITAQAFSCGLPILTTDYSMQGGIYADTYTMDFKWKNVLEVNGERVVDTELTFAWGRTQEDALAEISLTPARNFAYPSKCTTTESNPASFDQYMKTKQVCDNSVSMKWMTNPEDVVYPMVDGFPVGSDVKPECEALDMHMRFSGMLSDFLDMTNSVSPYHITRQDFAGAYTHKTQLLLRQRLHMQSGNTIERDIFYPLYIKTYSVHVMSFSAQSAVVPPAINRLLDVSVQYDHSTFGSVVEVGTRMCVSQPVDTTDQRKYTLVSPIASYDTTRTNPSFDPDLRNLGKAVYGKLSDGVTNVPGSEGALYVLNADDASFGPNAFQGLNDPRFDAVQPIVCHLLRQTSGESGINGSDPQFMTDAYYEFANRYFEFNCFDRDYACEFDNNEKWENLHIRFGTTFIVKSGELFTIDPLVPEKTSHFTSISVTTTAASTLQNFDVTMKIDVPASLQDSAVMPTWSEYHAENSDGLATLRGIVDGTGTVSNRIEREQRFRLTTYLTDELMRRQYVLYPMSLFAILKLREATSETLQSSSSLQSTGSSIQGPKEDLCGITPSMAEDLSAFDDFGKLVPIYQGLFQDGLSATDNSFVNPSAVSLSEFFHYGSVDSKLRDLLQSPHIYVSSSLRDDFFPVHEKGGLDLETSALSWQMINNLDLDYTGVNTTFELTFCFLGAVSTKHDSGYDMQTLLAEASKVETIPDASNAVGPSFTSVSCNALAVQTGASWIGGTTPEPTMPFGCYGLIDTHSNVMTSIGFNPSTEIMTTTGAGQRTYVCMDPHKVDDGTYKFRVAGLTCAQTVFSVQLTMDECAQSYQSHNYVVISDTSKPSGCIRIAATDTLAEYYAYNRATLPDVVTPIKCSSDVQCQCRRASSTTSTSIVSVIDEVCSLQNTVNDSELPTPTKRRLLKYTTGSLGLTSRASSVSPRTGNVDGQHMVELTGSSRSEYTTTVTTDTASTVTYTEAEEKDSDDEDSKRMHTLLVAVVSICSVVTVTLGSLVGAMIYNKFRNSPQNKSQQQADNNSKQGMPRMRRFGNRKMESLRV